MYFIQSTNQHGVHSPFVFDFVTKGLYKKSNIDRINFTFDSENALSKKEFKILLKIVEYFRIDKIYTLKTIAESKTKNRYNLLYIKDIRLLKSVLNLENISNYFIVIPQIHKNKETEKNWSNFILNQEATVTIDLFYFGLIFFRKEQAKEHFVIRV